MNSRVQFAYAPSLPLLQGQVDAMLATHDPSGSPVWDAASNRWAQMMLRREPASQDLRLREPQRGKR